MPILTSREEISIVSNETVWMAAKRKEVGYTCEYRFLSEEEYYNLIQQEENTEKVNENILISMGAQAELYEKLLATEENQLIIMNAVAELYEAKTGGN